MRVYNEISDLYEFSAWSGAIETAEKICNAGEGENFISMLEDVYPDGLTDTELNDLLWFDSDFCLGLVGLKDEENSEA